MMKDLSGGKDERWIQRMAAFAVAYTDRTLDDYEEFWNRREEVARRWADAG